MLTVTDPGKPNQLALPKQLSFFENDKFSVRNMNTDYDDMSLNSKTQPSQQDIMSIPIKC